MSYIWSQGLSKVLVLDRASAASLMSCGLDCGLLHCGPPTPLIYSFLWQINPPVGEGLVCPIAAMGREGSKLF